MAIPAAPSREALLADILEAGGAGLAISVRRLSG